MPIVRAAYRLLPEHLYHYTQGKSALNIITGGSGDDEEICFWLKNARCKNDAAELKLGEALTEGLQKYMHDHNRYSILNEIVINPDLVFINSFTEGEDVTNHLLTEYGNFRLEFDLRGCKYKNDIKECTYFKEENIPELTECYCATFDKYWPLISGETKDFSALCEYLMEGASAVMSIPLLKHLDEWEEECEWRHVLHRQVEDERMFTDSDGLPRMKVFYPASALMGITYFPLAKDKESDMAYYRAIEDWVRKQGWNTQVKMVDVGEK